MSGSHFQATVSAGGNDYNVNSPMMQEWLGKEVDREDLTCHDKWLCIMMPLLKLFKELLSRDGIIAIELDDNEVNKLGLLIDEVFGEHCQLACDPWMSEPSGVRENLACVSGMNIFDLS